MPTTAICLYIRPSHLLVFTMQLTVKISDSSNALFKAHRAETAEALGRICGRVGADTAAQVINYISCLNLSPELSLSLLKKAEVMSVVVEDAGIVRDYAKVINIVVRRCNKVNDSTPDRTVEAALQHAEYMARLAVAQKNTVLMTYLYAIPRININPQKLQFLSEYYGGPKALIPALYAQETPELSDLIASCPNSDGERIYTYLVQIAAYTGTKDATVAVARALQNPMLDIGTRDNVETKLEDAAGFLSSIAATTASVDAVAAASEFLESSLNLLTPKRSVGLLEALSDVSMKYKKADVTINAARVFMDMAGIRHAEPPAAGTVECKPELAESVRT